MSPGVKTEEAGIDAALKAAQRVRSGAGPCWRQRMRGDALKFIEIVEASWEVGSIEYSRVGLSRGLKLLGEKVAPGTISDHYRGNCRCE